MWFVLCCVVLCFALRRMLHVLRCVVVCRVVLRLMLSCRVVFVMCCACVLSCVSSYASSCFSVFHFVVHVFVLMYCVLWCGPSHLISTSFLRAEQTHSHPEATLYNMQHTAEMINTMTDTQFNKRKKHDATYHKTRNTTQHTHNT